VNTLCFVLMPFGRKPDANGRKIDFDALYRDVIKPAIIDAGLEPIRADEEIQGGIIHKPMFERLILCQYAVADLTLANANVFYELGIRHAVKPWRTVSIFADGDRLPFDVAYLRSIPYKLDDESGLTAQPADARKAIANGLRAARAEAVAPSVDSPLFQLLSYMQPPVVDYDHAEVFRQEMQYSEAAKAALAKARQQGTVAAIDAVLASLRPLGELEVSVLIDAMASYRAAGDWKRMIAFIRSLPRAVEEAVKVQEQLGFALNRDGQSEAAEAVLRKVLAAHGPSPETLGLLGRVYKDRWRKASNDASVSSEESAAILAQAIELYRQGFESDWRDAYPGINAVSLMEASNPPDPRARTLAQVVRYATEKKMKQRGANYWDHATLLELAIVECDEAGVKANLGNALMAATGRPKGDPETTAGNLAILRRARARRAVTHEYANTAERALRKKAGLPDELP
jgi:hypothetical protein